MFLTSISFLSLCLILWSSLLCEEVWKRHGGFIFGHAQGSMLRGESSASACKTYSCPWSHFVDPSRDFIYVLWWLCWFPGIFCSAAVLGIKWWSQDHILHAYQCWGLNIDSYDWLQNRCSAIEPHTHVFVCSACKACAYSSHWAIFLLSLLARFWSYPVVVPCAQEWPLVVLRWTCHM